MKKRTFAVLLALILTFLLSTSVAAAEEELLPHLFFCPAVQNTDGTLSPDETEQYADISCTIKQPYWFPYFFDGSKAIPLQFSDLRCKDSYNVYLSEVEGNPAAIWVNGSHEGFFTAAYTHTDGTQYTASITLSLPRAGFYSTPYDTPDSYTESFTLTDNCYTVYLYYKGVLQDVSLEGFPEGTTIESGPFINENQYTVKIGMTTETHSAAAILTLQDWEGDELGEAFTLRVPLEIHSSIPAETVNQTCGDKLHWRIENGTLLITDGGDPGASMYDYEKGKAPWYDRRDEITAIRMLSGSTIGSNAFYNLDKVTEVYLSKFMTPPANAFAGCTALERFEVEFDNIHKLRTNADGTILMQSEDYTMASKHICAVAPALTGSLTIPEYTCSIGSGAFDNSGLEIIELPAQLTDIADGAFAICPALHTVHYNDTTAMWNAITIGENNGGLLNANIYCVPAPGENKCGDDLYWRVEDGTLYFSTNVWPGTAMYEYAPGQAPWYPRRNEITRIEMYNGLTISSHAFYGLEQVTELILPSAIQSLGAGFGDLPNLQKFRFTGDVSSDYFTPSDHNGTNICKLLRSETLNTVPPITQFYYSLEAVAAGLTGSFTVLDGVEVIRPYAFHNCKIDTVVIPKSVKTIEDNAFADCVQLANVSYAGSREEWNAIAVGSGNEALLNAKLTCVGCGEGNHIWDEGKQGIPPSVDSFGEICYTCTVCGEVKWEYTDPLPAPDSPFTDVAKSDWFYQFVLWAVEDNVTGGIGNGKFGPHNPCTRSQVMTFLWRKNGSPEPASTENPFKDVSESDWFYKPVLWAVEQGITAGVSPDMFGPDQVCTRGQVVTFLWRAEGSQEWNLNPGFVDVSPNAYYYKPVIWAVKRGITAGISPNLFGADDVCTRAQVVTFLYK